MHPQTPVDDRERLAALATAPAFSDLHRILAEHEAGLLDILFMATTDANIITTARRWQIFRQYRQVLLSPVDIAAELHAERAAFTANLDPRRDPLAPEPPLI